jgi:hypothetical protein
MTRQWKAQICGQPSIRAKASCTEYPRCGARFHIAQLNISFVSKRSFTIHISSEAGLQVIAIADRQTDIAYEVSLDLNTLYTDLAHPT